MQITIPFKTPTVNNLYCPFNGRMILKKEAREIKKQIKEIIDSIPINMGDSWLTEVPLKVDIDVHENWYTKKDTVKHKDVMNRSKFLIDSVFQVLGIDDKFIFEHTINKIQSETEEKSVITIKEIGSEI